MFCLGSDRDVTRGQAFTLVELLVTVAILSLLLVLLIPAVGNIKGAADLTTSAYNITDVMQQARTYAVANETYVWVGFFEESAATASTNPATVGVGRLIISMVASMDGTTVYDPNNLAEIDPTKILQIGKLLKIDGVHLSTFTDGNDTADNFDGRPPAVYNTARIGDTTPPNASKTPFRYPVGSASSTPQYTFVKAIEFSPRGEARINNTNYSYKRIAEIGLRPAHGAVADINSQNVVAIQFGGMGGNIKIYRR